MVCPLRREEHKTYISDKTDDLQFDKRGKHVATRNIEKRNT